MKNNIPPMREFMIERLGKLRYNANLSATELSGRVGFSHAYMAKFENGDFRIPAEVLFDAISVCGSTVEEFFFRDIEKYKKIKPIIDILENLSDDKLEEVYKLLQK